MTVQDKPHLFKPGQSGNPKGKPKGLRNRLTVDVKSMIEEALQRAGQNAKERNPKLKPLSDGAAYLADQADKNPQAFLALVKQLLPSKIDVDVTVMSRELVDLLSQRREQLADMRSNIRDVTPTEENDDA